MFVSAESEIIATFLRRCCCPITVDDADVEELFLVKEHYSSREYGIEAPLSFKAPKSGIDPSVVDFRSPRFVLLNRQFFPLTAEVQKFQNVVENSVQRQLWLRTSTPLGQVGQDKFLKLL